MRLLRILLVLVVVAWVAGEVVLPMIAEREIAARVSERTPDVVDVGAEVGSFPVVSRLLVTGRVSEVSVTLDRARRHGLTYASVRFDLEGVHMDRETLLSDPRVTAIERGSVTATIDLSGLPAIAARVASLVGADVRVRGDRLLVGSGSVRLASDLLPCSPEAELAGEQVILTCSIADVPDILLDAAQS